MTTGISILFTTDDCPQGHWKDRKLPEIVRPVADGHQGVPNAGFEHDSPKDSINEKHQEGMKLHGLRVEHVEITGACDTELPLLPLLTFCLHIYFQ